jgi:hypothetical protein
MFFTIFVQKVAHDELNPKPSLSSHCEHHVITSYLFTKLFQGGAKLLGFALLWFCFSCVWLLLALEMEQSWGGQDIK